MMNVFVLYDKKQQNTTRKAFLFRNLSTKLERRPLPTLTNMRRAYWRNLFSIQNNPLVVTRSKRIVIDPRKSRHCQLESSGATRVKKG